MTRQFAMALRQRMTDDERLLWRHLRNRGLGGWKFRRQYPVGPFIVDFICVEKDVVIEVDGGQHADNEVIDIKRSAYLNKMGYRVVRFWNNEVLQETEAVVTAIFAILANDKQNSPSPQPHWGRGGGSDSGNPSNHVIAPLTPGP
jgi:very-short-patch-repair endonuclease